MTSVSSAIFSAPVDAAQRLLQRFARRRRRLLGIRGLLAGLAALVVTMVVAALIDRLAGAGDRWRLVLACTGYAAALAVAWRLGWGRLLRRDDPAALAAMLESAQPALRDQLVAAVEFSRRTRDGVDNGTSSAFREHVIRTAAQRAGEVDVERLLPWERVKRPAGVAGSVLAAVVIVALAAPHWQLGRMLARVMLPAASIEPASRFTVAFVEGPVIGAVRHVPLGEIEPVAVEVGRRFGTAPPDHVWIDVQDDEGHRTLPLFPDPSREGRYVGRTRFNADASLVARADAARTLPLAISAQARPTVESISKRITPPTYLVNRVAATQGESSEGDLEALTGSTAQLELRSNQPLAAVEVELLTAAREPAEAVQATISANDPFVAEVSFPIEFNGYWRVHLMSAATQLSQADPPLWTIRALPDAPPQIVLDSPLAADGRNRSLSLDAVIDPQATAIDDVGLAHLRRDVRVNSGSWQTRLFEAEPGRPVREMQLPEAVDVASLATEVGDRLEMRLVATDLRGNESRVELGQWSITGHAADPELVRREMRHRQVADVTRRMREAAQRLSETIAAESSGDVSDTMARRQLRLAATQRLTELRRAADDVWRTLLFVAPEASDDRDSHDITRLAKGLLRIRRQMIPATAAALADADDVVTVDVDSLLTLATAVDDAADRMHRSERWAAASTTSASLLADLEDGLDRFESQRRQLEGTEATARLRRRLAAITARTSELLAIIDEASIELTWRSPETIGLEQARTSLDRADEQLRRAMRNGVVDRSLEAVTNSYRAALDRTVAASRAAAVGLEGYLDDARDAVAAAMADREFGHVDAESLADMLTLAERSPRPDPMWLSDLAGAEAALQDTSAHLTALEEAVAVLQADADLRALATSRRVSGDHRRPPADQGRAAVAFAGDWARMAAALDNIASAEGLLDRASLADAASLLRASHIPRDALRFGRALGRGGRAEDTEGLGASAGAELETVRELIAPVVEAARQRLADPSHTLADRLAEMAATMRAEADRAESISRQTQVEDGAVKEITERLNRLAGPLQSLLNDLRKDGLRQDLMTPEGRRRARDADDAQLLIRRDMERIERAIRSVATTEEEERPEALASSAQAKAQFADDLDMLARHLRNREFGEEAIADSRDRLRAVEADAGVLESLAAQYDRMEELAQLQELEDPEKLAALEERLDHDEKLRQELQRLAEDTSRRATNELESAADEEARVAEALARAEEEIAAAAESMRGQLPEVAQQARELAEEQVEPLADAADAADSDAAGDAGQSLHAAADAADSGDARAAAERLAAAARRLRHAERERNLSARTADRQAGEIAEAAVRNGLQNVQDAGTKVAALQEAAERDRQAAEALADAAREADQLGRKARDADMAEEAAMAAEASSTRTAAEAQGPIEEAARGAAAGLARSSRHQQRVGRPQASKTLNDAAARADAAAGQVAAAQAAAREASGPGQARPSAESAASSLSEAAAGAQQASARSDTPASSDPVARGLAQMLDELDQSLAGSSPGTPRPNASATGEPPGSDSPGGTESGDAAGRLAETQARLMRQQRLGRLPSATAPGSTAGTTLGAISERAVTGIAPTGESGDWDSLPTLETTDLTPGAREDAPPEYRDLVDAYYRRMAQRSRASPRTSP